MIDQIRAAPMLVEAARETIAAKNAEIARLRAALGLYAAPTNWTVDGLFLPASPACSNRPDAGDTARAALAPPPEAPR